jgi:hypothetical protein
VLKQVVHSVTTGFKVLKEDKQKFVEEKRASQEVEMEPLPLST